MSTHIKEPLDDIFDTNDDSEAMVVQGLLEANEFEVLKTYAEAAPGTFSFSNSPTCGALRAKS